MKRFAMLFSVLIVVSMLLAACQPAAPAAPAAEAPAAEGKLAVGIVLPTKDEPRWVQDETRFKEALTKAGYDVEILFSQGDSAKEAANVEALISKGIKVLIICPQDGKAAAAAAKAARDAGVKVIAYDRLITDTDAVDFFATFNSFSVGAAQGQFLVDRAEGKGLPLYLYAGAASDNNAFVFFNGAWSVLQPKIADGTFVIKNSSEAVALQGKAELTRDEQAKIIGQVTTDWKFDVAKNLAEANLTAAKAADKGDVFILAPNDGTARAIADTFAADKDVKSYLVTGQDAEKASVQYVIDGKQSMTVFKDVRTLVADAITTAVSFLKGETPKAPGTENNGVIDVPATLSAVVTVTKDNVKEALIDSGYYPASEFTGLDAMAEAPAEPAMAASALDDAFAGKMKGTVVTMAGPFTDNDAVKFDESIKDFEAKTGIDIQYSGSKEFEASIAIAIEGGNPPDVVDFPQPGLLETFVKKGYAVDLSTFMDMDKLKANYNQSWLDMGTMEGPDGPILAGIWGRVNGKSLVWYPKAEFDKAGYTVPTTWDELLALTELIKEDGDTPWCVGVESGAATGWAATDWMEEIMLRTTSLENYDKWVKGELKFDSPEVKKAAEVMSDLWFTEGNVYGGRKAIATTSFGDSPKPMFENPPKCWLHKQGNFITSFFPEGKVAGTDYSFFYLPGIDEAYGKPVLVAGDIYAMFNDRPETRAVIEYFATGASVEGWVKAGGAISPHNDSSLDWYTNEVDRGVAEVILNASSMRFDASDLMPGAVGSGSFWKSMTSYISGSVDLDTALKDIDAAWPK